MSSIKSNMSNSNYIRMPYTPEIKVIIWFKRATQDAKAVISASVFIKNAKMANL